MTNYKKFVKEKSVRVQSFADGDFTYNSDYFLGEHYLLVKTTARNDEFLEVAPRETIDKFIGYVKLSETQYSSGQSLDCLINGDIFGFIPNDEELEFGTISWKTKYHYYKKQIQ